MVLRFIADVNVEKRIVDYLLGNGYDIKWIPDFNCEIDDEGLLKIANDEKRILITNDKDFGELTFLQRQHSVGIILIRVKGQDTLEKFALIEKLMLKYKEKIQNHFIVITKTKFRFTRLEDIK
jgi:predicted nuclease of predicted toxin-antitoxin system